MSVSFPHPSQMWCSSFPSDARSGRSCLKLCLRWDINEEYRDFPSNDCSQSRLVWNWKQAMMWLPPNSPDNCHFSSFVFCAIALILFVALAVSGMIDCNSSVLKVLLITDTIQLTMRVVINLSLLVVCCVAGLWHSCSVYGCRSFWIYSTALFTSTYFADDIRSLSTYSLFLLWNALPFILPLIISHNKTSFLNTCPNHLRFRCQIVFNMFLSYFIFCILFFQRIFSILLQI